MLTYLNLFKKNSRIFYFFLFNIIFYLSMSLSRSVHSLWFSENNQLPNYGLSYSTMAVAGIFSAYIGKKSLKINTHTMLKLGVITYSLGMLLRVFVNYPVIAIVSGFISGIGASTVILLMRSWLLALGNREERTTLVSLKKFSNGFGTALGGLISGVLIMILAHYFTHSLALILIIASLICACAIFTLPKDFHQSSYDSEINDKTGTPTVPQTKLKILIASFGVMSGLIASLFSPYVPVILQNQGFKTSLIGVTLTFMGGQGHSFHLCCQAV